MSQNFRTSYTETLGKLETQYCKLMVSAHRAGLDSRGGSLIFGFAKEEANGADHFLHISALYLLPFQTQRANGSGHVLAHICGRYCQGKERHQLAQIIRH